MVGELTGFCVALEAEHDFRRTVPSRGDVFRHVSRILLRVDGEATSQTKVANLEFAVGIDEQVAGLEVSVQDIGGVDIFETAENLVNKGLEVGVGQGLAGTNNGGKVAFHQLYCSVSKRLTRVSAPRAWISSYAPSYRYVSLKSFGRGMSMS